MTKVKLHLIALIFICFSACKTTTKHSSNKKPTYNIGNDIVVYKTHKDYSENIPIQLNEDKTSLVSFPAISDVKPIKKPIKLNKNYYLDQFGISKNTAFTSHTFNSYEKLNNTPPPKQLFEQIIDKDPFSEFYLLKNNELNKIPTSELIDSLNLLIDANQINKVMKRFK